mmetsp:Transcript_19003/g.41995  ORF Transcript_19003/g.41995 Transcript_19003/m.41995 type:complete len:297 (-) Transcript_19003:14-904(-)
MWDPTRDSKDGRCALRSIRNRSLLAAKANADRELGLPGLSAGRHRDNDDARLVGEAAQYRNPWQGSVSTVPAKKDKCQHGSTIFQHRILALFPALACQSCCSPTPFRNWSHPSVCLANGSRTVAVCPPQNKARESVVGLLTRGLRDSPVWRTNSASRAGASHIGPLARRASRPDYCLPMAVGKLSEFTAVGLHATPSAASEMRGNCTTPAKKKTQQGNKLARAAAGRRRDRDAATGNRWLFVVRAETRSRSGDEKPTDNPRRWASHQSRLAAGPPATSTEPAALLEAAAAHWPGRG